MASVIRQLRDLVPLRPLTVAEGMWVAELQAARFLKLVGIDSPPVPEEAISELPRIQVERLTPSPVAGAAQWSRGRWLIIINGADPAGRQRFTLAHEFKHVLDSPFDRYLYAAKGAMTSAERRERMADYFAGCLLMPRAWVKRHYCSEGIQELAPLAATFAASRQAMQVRLQQIGLAEPIPRCNRASEIAA